MKQHTTQPQHTGRMVFPDYDVEDVVPFLNWDALLDRFQAADRQALREAFDQQLQALVQQHGLTLQALIGIYELHATEDKIQITDRPKHQVLLANQGIPTSEKWIGCYALSAGIGLEQLLEKAEDETQKEQLIALTDALSEGFKQVVLSFLRRQMWGYERPEDFSTEKILRNEYRGTDLPIASPEQQTQLYELMGVGRTTAITLNNKHLEPHSSRIGLFTACDVFGSNKATTK